MRHKSIFLKLLTSYLITGFFSLGISSVFIFIRDSALNTAILKPLQTIFLWPLNIFSQNSLFDRQSSQVWWILNFSTAIFFIILAITSIKKKYWNLIFSFFPLISLIPPYFPYPRPLPLFPPPPIPLIPPILPSLPIEFLRKTTLFAMFFFERFP